MLDNIDRGSSGVGGSFKCPRIIDFAPNANFQWLTLIAKELKVSHSYGGLENVVETGAVLGSFMFLLPEEFSEQTSHSWNEVDNIAGDIATKFTEANQKIVNMSALGDGIGRYSGGDSTGVGSLVKSIGDASKQVQVKVDGALVYTDSTKRGYDFTFELVNQGDPIKDVIGPIKTLMSLSCARQIDALKIDFPAIFELTTESGIINIKNAALESVQATYKHGYDKSGYLRAAELSLSFKEIEPLYRHRVDMSSIGLVTTKPNFSTSEYLRDARISNEAKSLATNVKYGR